MSDSKSKKKAAAVAKPLLGRPGNTVKMGVVGMPNIGKSSLFNLLTSQQVPAENYPFCTIDPHLAQVVVPDPRFDYLVEKFQPAKQIPAVLSVTDIAGLVRGASENKGLGNAFLSHIFAVDGIYHLCRAFKDSEIEHVEGEVDPVRDLDIISTELIKKDQEIVANRLSGVQKLVERGAVTKAQTDEYNSLLKIKAHLDEGKDVREGDWDNKDIFLLNQMSLLTSKPVVYLVNISEKDFISQKNKWIPAIKEWTKNRSPGAPVIPLSVGLEQKLVAMDATERKTFLDENKTVSMLPKVITSGYHALHLIHFFTVGPDEVRCWTIRAGTAAPQAAGVIHTDFENGFICADTYSYNDFVESGSTESAVKAAGKLRIEGKLYIVQDGDIIHFKFNVTAAPKKKK